MAAQKKPKNNPTKAIRTMANTKRNFLSICSLLLINFVPLGLTLTITHLFGSSKKYQALAKPFWFPSLTLIHLVNLGSTMLMSLAAWLVWADGGFGLDSDALPLYISQVSLSIVWDPLVLIIGEAWLGFAFSLVNFSTIFGCYFVFGKVSPSSKPFIMPCLVWMGYLSLVTFKLMHIV